MNQCKIFIKPPSLHGAAKIHLMLIIGMTLLLGACSSEPPPGTETAKPPATAEQPGENPTSENPNSHNNDQLNLLFSEYREEMFKLNPLYAMFEGDYRYNHLLGNNLTTAYLDRSQALEERYLNKLAEINYAGLNEDDKLSFDIFKYEREIELERFRDGYARMDTLIPVTQFFSIPTFLAQLGGGSSAQPFHTAQDYDNWLHRIGEFPAWVAQAIANFRTGVKEGVVLPRILVERVLPQLAAHLVDKVSDSVFYQPLRQFPEAVPAAERERITRDYESAIKTVIIPTYRQLHDFLANEYLPQARESVGIGQLPGGQAWYAFMARERTTTAMTPAEIHEIGRRQAETIFAEMQAIKSDVGFEGDMQAFLTFLREDAQFFHTSSDALLESYRQLKVEIDAKVPLLFDLRPKADYVIQPIEAFRQVSSATAEYLQPAPDGSRPGQFYVNTYKLDARPIWQREALFVHEAVPGHHFQIAIAMEQENLPKFRRFGGPTAYVEGWGLYAETLGKELDLYRDPYQRMGALVMQIWRANRLIVDTGMHAMGWTREEAIDWMKSNTPLTETDIVAEVERYLAIPGQALAYKIGQLRITMLRQKAKERLGDDFNIRAFHRQVLKDGAMPLAILERKINVWIERKHSAVVSTHATETAG